MPTIKASSSFLANMVNGATAGHIFTTSTPSTTTIAGGNSTGQTALLIYKGSVANFSTFTDTAQRSSDLLIQFLLPNGANSHTTTEHSGGLRAVIGICTTSTAASASGTATWFLLRRATGTSTQTVGALIGTVGAIGSGADLEVPTPNIVVGIEYKSAGLIINFPSIYTF